MQILQILQNHHILQNHRVLQNQQILQNYQIQRLSAPWHWNYFCSTDLVIPMSGHTIQVEKKNLEIFLSVHARMHLACKGNIW